jgi:hypothetical protein
LSLATSPLDSAHRMLTPERLADPGIILSRVVFPLPPRHSVSTALVSLSGGDQGFLWLFRSRFVRTNCGYAADLDRGPYRPPEAGSLSCRAFSRPGATTATPSRSGNGTRPIVLVDTIASAQSLHVARAGFREYAKQYPDRRMTLQIAAHVIDEHVPNE